ncbi:Z-ring formation inhibitor MciZ [Paenibacillus alkaliterrae]|uniref:Z-ring formation inhibitor MciZ n=1 Tax=Paenibacillus alkaliterrae TaxID=320909 RepID=UPI001F2AF00D|nr:Z-ring formation inhibitor MciZ [Paenibacillus alkaliterrae]MCF2937535.1 Z-ring formation inhibitor MciZ [Paenibacillus alkaliterrae]
MKQYVALNHLRLVGKGWEIRHQLRKLSAASLSKSPLSEYTNIISVRRIQSGKER